MNNEYQYSVYGPPAAIRTSLLSRCDLCRPTVANETVHLRYLRGDIRCQEPRRLAEYQEAAPNRNSQKIQIVNHKKDP